MGDGSLSQDEIDALLQGADDIGTIPGSSISSEPAQSAGGSVSPAEQNAIRETLNMVVGTVAPSLAGYLGGKNLTISNAVVESKSRNALMADFPEQYVLGGNGLSGRG